MSDRFSFFKYGFHVYTRYYSYKVRIGYRVLAESVKEAKLHISVGLIYALK